MTVKTGGNLRRRSGEHKKTRKQKKVGDRR